MKKIKNILAGALLMAALLFGGAASNNLVLQSGHSNSTLAVSYKGNTNDIPVLPEIMMLPE